MPAKSRSKKPAPAPLAKSKKVTEPQVNALFAPKKRNYGIGGDIQPKRNLSRYVRWPKVVRIQRQRSILYKRLKVPPAIAQFSKTADRNLAAQVLRLASNYQPEDRLAKKARLHSAAAATKDGKTVDSKKPVTVKFGLNHVTTLVEQKKAQLVVIAHDVDPIELVLWLPALCRKMDVPYVIVKGKARVGQVVRQKTATCLAITNVNAADRAELQKIQESARANFNDRYDEFKKQWGGGILGIKSQHRETLKAKALAREAAKKAGAIV